MKVWSNQYTFNHPWETVVRAAVTKYSNPKYPSVLGVDVVDRVVHNGLIKSHRLLTTHWNLLKFAILAKDRLCHASEHSEIDINKKTFTFRTRNLTFTNLINVHETCVYAEHPEDKEKTILKHESVITIKNMPLIGRLESMTANSISTNADAEAKAIELLINSTSSQMSIVDKTCHTDKLEQSI
jgi:hypothetical protein